MKKKTEKHLYQKILHLALDIKAFNEIKICRKFDELLKKYAVEKLSFIKD